MLIVNSDGSTIQDCAVPSDALMVFWPNFNFLPIVELLEIVSDKFVESDACGIVNTPEKTGQLQITVANTFILICYE